MNDSAPLSVTSGVSIPWSELDFSAIRAAGPGGQHVNKTSSAVELRFDVRASEALTDAQREKILATADRRVTGAGVIVIKAQSARSQLKNKNDAIARLVDLLRTALRDAPPRVPTATPRAQKERRRRDKAKRSAVKNARKPPPEDA
ncbi:MAG: alternative ribosome rescue aminoacyl-tRNA hydrolase ArfB [Pseudomonadota bacterium]